MTYGEQKKVYVTALHALILAESGRFDEPIVTEVLAAETFYPAEEYHQDFYLKAPDYYEAYVDGSQRYPFLERIWGDESDEG